jgi:hypothetical protein
MHGWTIYARRTHTAEVLRPVAAPPPLEVQGALDAMAVGHQRVVPFPARPLHAREHASCGGVGRTPPNHAKNMSLGRMRV